jgi:hypothetical protein
VESADAVGAPQGRVSQRRGGDRAQFARAPTGAGSSAPEERPPPPLPPSDTNPYFITVSLNPSLSPNHTNVIHDFVESYFTIPCAIRTCFPSSSGLSW